ncbi:SMI1/KNR4 family protein [Actinoplanes sp. NPDC051861]|uniref:SMI1/KNR4 family protein n=1 Tax=Actinoplanes sp. NPDC051861 TaxID=3155170 RepID=UPI00343625F5
MNAPREVVIESAIQFADVAAGVYFDVRGMDDEVPRVLLGVTVGDERVEEWRSLGDTVPVGDEIWRLEDIEFGNTSDDWLVTLRPVGPDTPAYKMPPLTPNHRVWSPALLQPFGTLDEGTLVALEERIGTRLPREYRQWLAENNGASPAQDVWIKGWNFCLNDLHALLGVRPDAPYLDLGFGESRRKPFLTDDYLVIAVPLGGVLAVKIRGAAPDQIVFLSDPAIQASFGYAQQGYASQADFVVPGALVVVAPSINVFCANLQPMPPVEPAQIATPGPW